MDMRGTTTTLNNIKCVIVFTEILQRSTWNIIIFSTEVKVHVLNLA